MRGERPGKRERQRVATRERLRACALERFRDRGFEKTSVAEVARDAGVTERTFYRHFPTKEAVLFQDYESRLDWFQAALALRPHGEPLLESVRVAVESFPDDREVVRQVGRLRADLLTGGAIEVFLREVQAQFAQAIEGHVARRLAGRPDADLTAAVLGGALAGALLASLRVWGERGGRDTDDLREITRQSLDLLRELPAELR